VHIYLNDSQAHMLNAEINKQYGHLSFQ